MYGRAGGGAQYQAKRKVAFNPDILEPGALGQLEQLVRFEAAKYRQRAIVPKQAIVQNQFPTVV